MSASPSARATRATRAARATRATRAARATRATRANARALAAARAARALAAPAAPRSFASRSTTSTAGISKPMTVEEKISNTSEQAEINKLILEIIFENDQQEQNKYTIRLNNISKDPNEYLIFFKTNENENESRDYKGHRYKLFKTGDKFMLDTQDTPPESASEGGRRRKTQKKNKHKKRTTSKRRYT